MLWQISLGILIGFFILWLRPLQVFKDFQHYIRSNRNFEKRLNKQGLTLFEHVSRFFKNRKFWQYERLRYQEKNKIDCVYLEKYITRCSRCGWSNLHRYERFCDRCGVVNNNFTQSIYQEAERAGVILDCNHKNDSLHANKNIYEGEANPKIYCSNCGVWLVILEVELCDTTTKKG